MAKGILSLEISSKRIRYIYLERERGKFILSHCQEFFFEQDPVTTKDPGILTTAIQEILLKERISPSKVCLTISGKDIFIHLINLPKMSDNELREVIVTEIEKIPIFSDKEFDYIYSAFKLDEQRIRVLFTAIAKENLNFYIQGVCQSKIYLESLEVSPLNLLGLLHSQLSEARSEALLVLEDHSSQMLIFSKDKCGLFYTMSTGKADLYPFKKQQLDNSIFSTWTGEIERVFRFYLKEAQRKGIEKLWFIWDSQEAQGLDKLLNGQLGLEVTQPRLEGFNIELAEKEAGFNPIFFLSLAAPLMSLKKLKSMFFFEHFLQGLKQREVIKKTSLVTTLFIFLVGCLLGIPTMNFIMVGRKISAENRQITTRIVELEKQTAELKRERADYLDIKDRLLKQATFVRRLNRVAASEIFAKIVLTLPENVSLSFFELSESGEVKIKGSTLKIDLIAEFIRKINAAAYFEDVKFNFLRERELEGIRIVEFDIHTKLKPDLNEKK